LAQLQQQFMANFHQQTTNGDTNSTANQNQNNNHPSLIDTNGSPLFMQNSPLAFLGANAQLQNAAGKLNNLFLW